MYVPKKQNNAYSIQSWNHTCMVDKLAAHMVYLFTTLYILFLIAEDIMTNHELIQITWSKIAKNIPCLMALVIP